MIVALGLTSTIIAAILISRKNSKAHPNIAGDPSNIGASCAATAGTIATPLDSSGFLVLPTEIREIMYEYAMRMYYQKVLGLAATIYLKTERMNSLKDKTRSARPEEGTARGYYKDP